MAYRTGLFTLLILAALSGCDWSSGGSEAQAQAEQEQEPQISFDEKFNRYINGYNVFISDGSGLATHAENYHLLNIPKATPANTLSIGTSIPSFESALRSLQEGKAMESTQPTDEIDAAIDRLTPPLEEILAQWRDLEPYYASRAYRQDDLAKGKAADPVLKTAYAESLAALDGLGEALLVVQRQRSEQRVVRLKEAGHVAEASLVETLQKADLLATAVSRNELEEAARVAPEFEAALAAMRENADSYAGSESGKILYGVVTDTLTRVLGCWRDFEANQNEVDLRTLIGFYNSALRSASSIPLPA